MTRWQSGHGVKLQIAEGILDLQKSLVVFEKTWSFLAKYTNILDSAQARARPVSSPIFTPCQCLSFGWKPFTSRASMGFSIQSWWEKEAQLRHLRFQISSSPTSGPTTRARECGNFFWWGFWFKILNLPMNGKCFLTLLVLKSEYLWTCPFSGVAQKIPSFKTIANRLERFTKSSSTFGCAKY